MTSPAGRLSTTTLSGRWTVAKGRGQVGRPGWFCLLAYCVASGVLGTALASVASLAVSGTARLEVWLAVLVAVAVTAGLAYELGPVARWRDRRRSGRRRA